MRFVSSVSFAALALMLLARPAPAADQFEVDGTHSSLVFKIKHLGVAYVWGMFHAPQGEITWDSADPRKSSFDVSAKVESIDTGNQKRDAHLKSPDFFDAKQFPTLSFKSNSVKPAGENKYEVSGDLTIHGVTKPITVTLTHVGTASGPQGGTKTGFDGSFTLNRQDFGVSYMPQGLGDEVTVFVALEANKK